MNVDRFVGIPWKFGESSFEACDCIGLCRLFYKEMGWKDDFSDGKPVTEYSSFGVWRRLYTYAVTHMDRVNYDDLQFGDFVIFMIEGDVHTGIYLGYGKLLCMQVPTVEGMTSTIYHRAWWTPFFKYGFRKR